MFQCTCACSHQAYNVQTCMIGAFVSMHKWDEHLYIRWSPIPFAVSLPPSALKAPSTSSCRRVRGGEFCSSIHHSWPQGATRYSMSTEVMSNYKRRQDNDHRHLCESLKVVALQGRVFEGGRHLLCSCCSHAPLGSKTIGRGSGGQEGVIQSESSKLTFVKPVCEAGTHGRDRAWAWVLQFRGLLPNGGQY